MTARRGLAIVGAALAAALLGGRLLAGVYAGWAWYGALGAGSLWTVRFIALTTLRVGLFGVAFAFTFANLFAMRRSIVSLVLPRRLANLEIGEAVPGPALTVAAALLSLLIAAAVVLPQDDWLGLVRAQWAVSLGESDPYVSRDMVFWVAWLPFERSLHEWSVTLAVVVGATVMLLYGLTPSVQVQRGRVHVSTWVRRHFAVFSAVLLLLVAWGYRLDAFDLLITGSGVRGTFTAFDHRVMYPYLITVGIGTAAVGLLVAWTGWLGYQRATISALLIVLVAGPLGRLGLPLLDRRTASERDRSALDRPYAHVRLLYTRRAYGVDDIVRGGAADSLRLPVPLIPLGVSSWDPAALMHAATDDRGGGAIEGAPAWLRRPNGSLVAMIPTGRESEGSDRAPLAVQAMDPADADERGAPWPTSDLANPSLPALAVGVGLPAVRLIADTAGRVAGPRFVSGWQRVALAWSVRRLGLAFRDAEPAHTRLLVRRDVRERVQALLPFFTAGTTPQAFVVHDSLWWSVELFNTSEDYPLSEPLLLGDASLRYAVAAGTALVNAHSGRVQVVLPEVPDGMTRWWRDHLPALFVPRRAVDADLLAALPPPVDRAVVQGSALARTGFRNDTIQARPLLHADDADADLLPGAPTPFVTAWRSHPLAWGIATVDGLDRLRGVFVAVGGVCQCTMLIEQPDSARWSSVLDQLQRVADSAKISRSRRHPRRGRVQVIPTEAGALVMQSFYEWPPDREPALAGVVALLGGVARTGATLGTSMGGAGHPIPADAGLRVRVARLYAELQDARRRGDWVAFGRAMDALGRLIEGRP